MPAVPSLPGPGRGTRALAAIFLLIGVTHFIRPGLFEAIVPRWVPRPRLAVYLSGVVELACGAGLLAETGWAGPLGAALLLAVWPANFQMALDASREHRPAWYQAGCYARLPLQLPMIATALRARDR